MRVRLDVAAQVADPIPWPDVFTPVRGFLYGLVQRADPELSRVLHDQGWGASPLRPLGGTCPLFLRAPRTPGAYSVSGDGSLWIGSPVPAVASALLAGAAALTGKTVRWGTCPLLVRGVALEPDPPVADGRMRLSTCTPVLAKVESRWVLPDHPAYRRTLEHNLRRKADLLGVPGDVELDVEDAGPRRLFKVDGAPRIGATLTASLAGDPLTLSAVASWGLGLHNVAGFGWAR